MNLTDPSTVRLGQALCQAWRSGQPLSAADHAEVLTEASQAYRVQEAVGEALGWWGPGQVPPVWKSGAGGRLQPFKHAPLPTEAVRGSPGGDDPVDLSDRRWHAPRLEAELALRLGRAVLPEQVDALEPGQPLPGGIGAWVDSVAVAIEVVDSRWIERAATPQLLQLADGQWHGALALGEWQPAAALASHDWSQQRCELWQGEHRVASVQGTHPLGDPFWLLPIWLRHLTRHGATVPAGTVVTTGNWLAGAPDFVPGQRHEVHLPGLGRVAVCR